MNKSLFLILILVQLFSSCSLFQKKDRVEIRNRNLLGFKSTHLAEHGEKQFEYFEQKMKENPTKIQYLDDIIYVTDLKRVNACGNYFGNIEIRNDTIKLTYNLLSDEVCTSVVISKLTYFIDNPKKRNWVIE